MKNQDEFSTPSMIEKIKDFGIYKKQRSIDVSKSLIRSKGR